MNKAKKRMIENNYTNYKIANGVNGNHCVMLMGPAILPHINNSQKVNFEHIHVAELNQATRYNMLRDQDYVNNKNYMTIYNQDFFDLTIGLLNNNYILSDIDYDGTFTVTTVDSTLFSFLDEIYIRRQNLASIFSLTMTFSERGSYRWWTSDFLDKFEKAVNIKPGFTIKNFYRNKNYRDANSGTMSTELIIIENKGIDKNKNIIIENKGIDKNKNIM